MCVWKIYLKQFQCKKTLSYIDYDLKILMWSNNTLIALQDFVKQSWWWCCTKSTCDLWYWNMCQYDGYHSVTQVRYYIITVVRLRLYFINMYYIWQQLEGRQIPNLNWCWECFCTGHIHRNFEKHAYCSQRFPIIDKHHKINLLR